MRQIAWSACTSAKWLTNPASTKRPARRLTGLAWSNGLVSFVLNGPTGSNYLLQTSTNLSDWQPFALNNIGVAGTNLNLDVNFSRDPRKFYRAILGNTVSLSMKADSIWQPLPGRVSGGNPYIYPTFPMNTLTWYCPQPANANRGDAASKTTFSSDNIRFDLEYFWTGGGTIELFVCDANDLNVTNWVPGEYYCLYVSSADVPYAQIKGGDSNGTQFFQSANLEGSAAYKGAWVTNSILKTGSSWSFYRNNNLLHTTTYTNLNGKRLSLIVAPSNNSYKGGALNVTFRRIQVSIP